jgi:hypothetical protein
MGDRSGQRTKLFRGGVVGCLLALAVILAPAAPVAAQEGQEAALSENIPERTATEERQVAALQQDAAMNSYLSMRPYLSRYLGFAVFLGFCLVFIFFLRKRIEQREYLRRIGFLETPEIEPEED